MTTEPKAKKPLKIVPSDIFPAVRRFLEAEELSKTRKAFDNETCADEEAEAPPKKSRKARALEELDLTTACQLQHKKIVAADLHQVLRRFFAEGGLRKTLKAFGKDRPEEEHEAGEPAGKKAKILAELELTDACKAWVTEQIGTPEADAGTAEVAPKKRKKDVPEEEAADENVEPVKKKQKSDAEAKEESAEAVQPAPKRGKNKKGKEDRPPPVPFKRIDEEKCRALIKDARLLDNTHKAKEKFGNSAGDSWADKASEDLLKTKGKGFRKEMAKKKRASWRGGGAIDQGVNSVKFADSSDEE